MDRGVVWYGEVVKFVCLWDVTRSHILWYRE